MRIQRPTITQITELKGDGAQLTGSFSGSFNTWEGISGKPDPLLSSSAQIADDISGSITSTSSSIATDIAALVTDSGSFSTRITTAETELGNTLISGAAQIASEISGSFTDASASLAADIVANSGDISGLNSYTSSLKTAISVSGANTTLLGNLTVQGTQTALDTATLNVADLNILIASGASNAAAANGAGLTVDGASATLTYASTGDKWVFNKVVDVPTSGLLINSTAVTSTGAELNLVDGSSAGTIVNSKAVIYGAAGEVNATKLQVGGVDITSTPAEINQLDDVTVGGTATGDIVTIDGSQTLTNKTIAASQVTEISGLTDAEGAQLENIDTVTISNTQWGYLGASNQGITTTSDVQFDSFGVGTAASGTTGEIRATGDITAYYSSDERLKENFKTLDGALDKVNQLNGYEFDWKDGIEDVVSKKGHDIGVKAQEVQALYPELVHERDNGYLAVDYVKLTAVLLHAVKELSAKVDELSK